MAQDSHFISWFGSLDQDIHHVFIREQIFQIHGAKARSLAMRFYGPNNNVLKDDTLSVSKKMLGEIISFLLLDQNQKVQLWRREQDHWAPVFKEIQTPGRYSEIEKFLGGFFISKSKEPVIASIWADPAATVSSNSSILSYRVGISIFGAMANQMRVYEFVDDLNFSKIECLLTQYGVREVLVSDEGNYAKKRKRDDTPSSSSSFIRPPNYNGVFLRLLERIGIAYTIQPPSLFKLNKSGAAGSQAKVVTQLQTIPAASRLQGLSDMPLAVATLHALVDYMDVLESGNLIIEIGDIERFLQYDAGASRALGIFRESGSIVRCVTSFTEPQKKEDAGDSYTDIEEGVYGGIMEESSESEGVKLASGVASLFDLLSACIKTKGGSRMLRRWLQMPIRDLTTIEKRQSLVALLCDSPQTRNALRGSSEQLLHCPDLEKVCQKLRRGQGKKYKNGCMEGVSLVDLITAYRSVWRLKNITSELEAVAVEKDNAAVYILSDAKRVSTSMEKFLAMIEELVDSEALYSKGGMTHSTWKRRRMTGETWLQVRPNFTPEMAQLSDELGQSLTSMEKERERVCQETGLGAKDVHLEYSSVHGSHLRVTKKDSAKALKKLSKENVRTLSTQKTGTLFVTTKMVSLVKLYEAQKNSYIYAQRDVVAQAAEVASTYLIALAETAQLLSEVDCVVTFAHIASLFNWTRPRMVEVGDADDTLHFKDLRHPLVEAVVGSARCVPSDFSLPKVEGGEGRVMILTGPNMGGKSTYIRAVGLAVILAHMGSFVPASNATVPIFDRVMCRVGSSDSLACGMSTFMTEMRDISAILEKATAHSLVIIDELGRGTSTHDGYGIAYSCLESLASRGVLTLFATHFHELTLMNGQVPCVFNKHVRAVTQNNDLVMLYQVEDGPSSESMGFRVARLSGFPEHIVMEAERIAETM